MPIRNIIADLRNGNYKPVYFLQGEEPFYIDRISDFISENALSEDEKSFNQTVLYGLDTDVATIVSEAKRFPMMAQRQVVIIKEAQRVRNLIPTGDNPKSELLSYLENPLPSTVLVFCHKYKKIDARKKAGKRLKSAVEKNGVFYTADKVKDWHLTTWISDHVQSLGYHIDPRTATVLGEYLGNDLSKIDNELGKLFIDLEKGGKITPELIETNIGISKDFNVFELQNAMLNRNVQKANRIIIHFSKNLKEHPIQMLVATLLGFFFKILLLHYLQKRGRAGEAAKELRVNPYFIKDYQLGARNYSEQKLKRVISYLRDADLKSKGVDNPSADAGDLMKELVFKIMH
ncbi:MAG: DNA polymerase III subunit delta [Flavobacteriales bacterium]|nr:DNA polymerase III subunit delta [Flavobacteriales bacterium]